MSTAQSRLVAMAAAFPGHANIATTLSPLTSNYSINNFLSFFEAADLTPPVIGDFDLARFMGSISNSPPIPISDLIPSVGFLDSPNSVQAPTPSNITPPNGSPNLPDAIERSTHLSLSLPGSLDVSSLCPKSPASLSDAPSPKRRRRRNKDNQLFVNEERPVHRIRRRRTRNGSIPEEDDILLAETPKSVASPGCCKQSILSIQMLPDSVNDEEQQMNTPDDPVIHSPPSLRLNQQGGNNATFNQMGLMQCPPNAFMMSGGMPGSNSSTDSLMQQGSCSQDDGINRPRRTKTCRVCGDHATGYNFNVITCESCKAFFRRNALRPKLQTDFKCPYSEDCEINAVSRRFCQKCRLKKCFDVGMKKEWILNEEQLRRRKNSRLNSKGGNMRSPGMSNPSSVGSSSGGAISPMHNLQQQQQAISRNSAIVDSVTNNIRNEMTNLGRLNAFGMHNSTDLMSPPSVGNSSTTMSQQMLSPINSMSSTNTTTSISPNVVMQRDPICLNDIVAAYLRQQNPHFVLLPPPTTSQTVKIVANTNQLLPPSIQQQLRCGERIRIDFPITDYALLVSACNISSFTELPGTGDLLLPDEAYEQMSNTIKDHVQRAIQRSVQQQQREEQQRQAAAVAAAQAVASHSNNCYSNSYDNMHVRTASMLPNIQYEDISNLKMGPLCHVHPDSMSPELRSRYIFIERAITTYLMEPLEEITSNELTPLMEASVNGERSDQKLNAAEMHELDEVKQAFACMDEPLHDNHAAQFLMKTEHAPGDIMNIMDVTIRRIVKTAKRLEHFQEISNAGKLQLLKSSMIDMLTIRGVVLLDEQMKNWNTPVLGGSTRVSVDMFDRLSNPEQRTRFIAFCKEIHPEMRRNPMAIMLIALIVLFDYSRAAVLNEADQEIVRGCHEMYYNLLQRYLESIYNEHAPEMIKSIPRALRQLIKINKTSTTLFAGHVDNKTVAPLATEFFKTQTPRNFNNPFNSCQTHPSGEGGLQPYHNPNQ